MGIINKIKKLDWKTLNRVISHMSKRSGRNKIDLFLDMYKLYKNEGYTWLNYYTYYFDKVTDKEIRSTFLSEYRDNGYIYNEIDNQDSLKKLRDKGNFSVAYKDFTGREIIDIRDKNENKFNEFIKKHPIFFAKVPSSCGGKGVERIIVKNYDKEELFKYLLDENLIILEEPIKQHEEMSKLSANSVNTIRTGTAIDEEGNIRVIYMVLRTSISDSHLDNGSQGGVWTILNDEGVIDKPMFTNIPMEYITEINPGNGFSFRGFKVPMIEELKKTAIKAAKVDPGLRYVGWDIAISVNGPVIIEGNDDPSVELYQSYVHMEDGRGKKDLLEKALGITFKR